MSTMDFPFFSSSFPSIDVATNIMLNFNSTPISRLLFTFLFHFNAICDYLVSFNAAECQANEMKAKKCHFVSDLNILSIFKKIEINFSQ